MGHHRGIPLAALLILLLVLVCAYLATSVVLHRLGGEAFMQSLALVSTEGDAVMQTQFINKMIGQRKTCTVRGVAMPDQWFEAPDDYIGADPANLTCLINTEYPNMADKCQQPGSTLYDQYAVQAVDLMPTNDLGGANLKCRIRFNPNVSVSQLLEYKERNDEEGIKRTLQGKVTTLSSENSTLTSKNSTLTTQNSKLASQVSTLESENTDLETENTDLESEISDLRSENNKLKTSAKKVESVAATPAKPQPVTFGSHNTHIRSRNRDNYCLSVPYASQTSGEGLIMWDCHGGWAGNQRFTRDDKAQIVIAHSGKCLDVNGWQTDNLARVIQWDCHGGANQQWDYDGQGRLHPRNAPSKCLDVLGSSTGNDAQVVIYDCHDGNNQKWDSYV
jgi:cell division protein FtsB